MSLADTDNKTESQFMPGNNGGMLKRGNTVGVGRKKFEALELLANEVERYGGLKELARIAFHATREYDRIQAFKLIGKWLGYETPAELDKQTALKHLDTNFNDLIEPYLKATGQRLVKVVDSLPVTSSIDSNNVDFTTDLNLLVELKTNSPECYESPATEAKE